jgi:hypothetical protein
MSRDQPQTISVVMTVIFVVLCITVSWLFIGLAAGSALVGLEHVWKRSSLAARVRRRTTHDS